MAINKVVYGNSTLIDLTSDTVASDNLLSGATAHDRSGASIVGSVVTAEVVDNLTTQDATKALSANQGYVLKQALDEVADDVEDLKVTEEVDTEPYLIRQSKGNMADIELVGGSVAWNQLVKCNRASTTLNNVTVTKVTGGYTLSGTASAYSERAFDDTADRPNVIANHVYFWGGLKANSNVTFYAYFAQGIATNTTKETIVKPSSGISNCNLGFTIAQGSQVNTTIYPTLIDLTQLFGTTIADAIYAMEQASTGSGVAFFRKYFPKAYYAYDSGSIQSVCVSGRKVVGFNQWDGVISVGGFNPSGDIDLSYNTSFYSKNIIGVIPNTDYYVSTNSRYDGHAMYYVLYDSNGNRNSTRMQMPSSRIISVPNDAFGLRIYCFDALALYQNDICINISDTAKNGTYEPYEEHVYPMPNEQLRGLFTIENGKLKANGDILESSGKLTRKFGIDDFTSLTWSTRYTGSNNKTLSANLSATYKTSTETMNLKCLSNKYDYNGKVFGAGDLSNPDSKNVGIYSYSENQTIIYLVIPVNESAQGSFLYELATSTTESASPFQNPQRSDVSGTEEFVDYEYDWMHNRDVAMPVGHNTKYISSEALAYSEDYADGLLKYVENDLIPPKADITALTNYDFSGMTTAPLSISKDDYFYMDGSLCKALVNINQGATLTYYTNYITCSVATELNELRNKTEWHEVLSGTQTLSTTEDETLMWTEQSYYPTYFGCDFFVFSDLAGFYLKDFSYGGHDGSITFPKWSSAVTVKYKIMARGEANQSGSGITTYYNAPILNQ